jgi:hypothetical protein
MRLHTLVCGHLGVRKACARSSFSTRGCVRARRPPGRGRQVEPAGPTVGPCRTSRLRLRDSGASNVHELGDMRSPCSRPCPPPGTCLERPHGGRQRVPRQVQVACTIASMGQACADRCGLTRTCAVVANCHHRATCGFAPACRAVRAGPPPALGLIRTVAVVPIWHRRVTWGSTEPPTRHLACSGSGEQTGQQWFCQIGRTI